MDIQTAQTLGMAFATGLGVIGPSIGMGILVGKALEAIGRNPEAHPKILSTMLIGAALTEAIAILALVFAILIGKGALLG